MDRLPIHFNLLFFWITIYLNSEVEARYLSNSNYIIMSQYLSNLYLVISQFNINLNSFLDIGDLQSSQLIKLIWIVIYLIYNFLILDQYPSILIFVLAKFDKKYIL